MMTTKALLVKLEAKPGMDEEIEAFLKGAEPLVKQEKGTLAWFAIRYGRNEYGIFDAFTDEQAREDHLNGPVAKALMIKAPALFAKSPEIHKLDVLSDKLPTGNTQQITKAILLTLKPKEDNSEEVEKFLRDAKPMVEDEPDTISWFALRMDDGQYAIFDVFTDNGARLKHLVGRVPRELAANAFHLLGGLPDLELLSVHAQKL